jgi:DNA-binding transcriptional LysR family regulator
VPSRAEARVAAPALVGDAIGSPADLRTLPSLDLARPQRDHAWELHHADGQVATVPHAPRLITDDMSVLREAAIAGARAVQLPTIFIWDDIRSGRLVHVLPAWRPPAGIVHAVFPSRRGLLPSVRALVEFLARECAIQRAQANMIVPPVDDARPAR